MANNKTFIGGKPIWGNACVGNNGQPSYVEYARGYSESANLLIDTVLKNRLTIDILPPTYSRNNLFRSRLNSIQKHTK